MTVREKELAGLPSGDIPARGTIAKLVDRIVEPFRRGSPAPPHAAMGFYTDTTVCIGCKACEVACKQWNQLPADGFNWTGNSYDNTGELSATSWRHVKFVEQLSPGAGSPPTTVGTLPSPLGGEGSPALLRTPLGGEGSGVRGDQSPIRLPLDIVPSPNRWLMMSDVCKHCVTAPCQQACPTGAIIHNEFENVYIQADICNGCSYCIAACPFGVITRSSLDGHSHKCTLCYDRQRDGLVPACAKACPTASIQFGPIEELHQRARQRVEELHRRGVPRAHLYGDGTTDTYSRLNSFYLLVDRPAVYGLPERPFNPWLHMHGDYVRSVAGALVAIAVVALVVLFSGQ
jgi:formate dehydrogenase iron-sulfur subunit